jgi:hypothetical protein
MATFATYTNSYDANAAGVITGFSLGPVTISDDLSPDSTATLNTSNQISTDVGGHTQINSYNSSNNEVLITDGSTYLVLSNTDYDGGGQPVFDVNNADYTYCFLAGTKIATPSGFIKVDDLTMGDEINSINGGIAKVRFNFIQVKSAHLFSGKKHYPIKICANALADNVPSTDLYVTADHAIYLAELAIFAEASTLINGISIYQLKTMPAQFTYYHILCDNQEIVFAENTPVETFIDNATLREFDNYEQYLAIYPNAHEMQELDIARAKSARQLPSALKIQLANRAKLLFPQLIGLAA